MMHRNVINIELVSFYEKQEQIERTLEQRQAYLVWLGCELFQIGREFPQKYVSFANNRLAGILPTNTNKSSKVLL